MPSDKTISMLMSMPVKTGRETPEGRPHWYSPEMGHYSEYSDTSPYMGGWITSPTINEHGQIDQPVGRVDPITGEVFPAFKTKDEAERYAKMRSRMR